MSTETPVCMGCFVNNPRIWDNQHLESLRTNPTTFSAIGLTADEKLCLKHLADAWNLFVNMAAKHPDDDSEFHTAIHDAQKMIALRVARRVDTDVWKQPE